MKRSMFLLGSLSCCFAAHVAEASPDEFAEALKSGRPVAIANANVKDRVGGCIGVSGGRTDAKAPVMRFTCDLPMSDHPNNQYWILKPTKVDGEEGYFTIVNWKSQKCLGVNQGSPLPERTLGQFTCDNRANQKWRLRKVKRGNLTAEAIENYDRLCIYAGSRGPSIDAREGAPLLQVPCNGQPDQDWRVIRYHVN